MLKICFALLFVSFVVGQTTTQLLLEHKDYQSNFTISMNSSGFVSWGWNELSYAVLGSLYCPPAQPTVRFNREWQCDFDTTGTGDELVDIAPNCTSGYMVKSIGGNFSCQPDLDTLRSLNCSSYLIAKWNGSAFVCANDLDNLAATTSSCSGILGYPRFNDKSGDFSCLPRYKDKDIARDLIPNCTNGELIVYLGNGTWGCGIDHSLLVQITCATQQTLIWSSNGWVCGQEKDTLRDIIPLCNNTLNIPVKVSATSWGCMATETVQTVHPNATVVLSASFAVSAGTTRVPATGTSGLGGFPWNIAYSSIITAWEVRVWSGGNLTTQLFIGTSLASSLYSNTTNSFAQSPAIDLSVAQNNTIGVVVLNNSTQSASLTVDIYVQTFLY